MEKEVTFPSEGLKLSGVLHTPDGMKASDKRPGFLLLPGFGGTKSGAGAQFVGGKFAEWGYAALRFDQRGCGDSEGEYGRILCQNQVADTRNALTWLAEQKGVDGTRIAVQGSSFGGAVAVYTAGVDERVAAVISCGGWGDGERKFKGQHPGPEKWKKFTDMLAEGRRHREATGQSLMVPRYDIVPIPGHLRGNVNPKGHMEFPAETAQSMFDFRADEVVANIAPRPLLLFHPAKDSVTSTEQSVEMFKRAGQPTELILMAGVDHFTFSDDNPRPMQAIKSWLDAYFPA